MYINSLSIGLSRKSPDDFVNYYLGLVSAKDMEQWNTWYYPMPSKWTNNAPSPNLYPFWLFKNVFVMILLSCDRLGKIRKKSNTISFPKCYDPAGLELSQYPVVSPSLRKF